MQIKHIWGLAGIGIGALGGYVLAGVYFWKKNQQIIDELAEEKASKYIEEMYEYQEEYSEEAEEPSPREYSQVTEKEVDYTSFYKKPSPREIINMSNKAMAEAEHPQDSEEDEAFESIEEKDERLDAELHGDQVLHKEPFEISEDDYAEESHYDKEVLYWYDNDDILATESDEIIEDVMRTVGTYIDQFDNPEIEGIFVRNPRLSTDYNIIRLNESFMEHIEGVPDWGD